MAPRRAHSTRSSSSSAREDLLAVNLLRAQKCSERAKQYRGGNGNGSYRDQAYRRKQWSMDSGRKIIVPRLRAL